MNKKLCVILLLLSLIPSLFSQSKAPVVKYWVGFNDKAGTPFTLTDPSKFLSQKSLQRRANYNISLHPSDLPVTPSYIHQVDTVKHVNVIYVSKWLNGVVITIDSADVAPGAISQISSFSFVTNTSRVKKNRIADRSKEVPAQTGMNRPVASTAGIYGGSGGQLRQLGVDCLHNKGYRGQGITIAVCDAGFLNVDVNPVFDSLRNGGRLKGTYDFVSGDKEVFDNGEHGTMVLSCMAGIRPGDVMGTAPMADYWLFKTEDGPSETISEEYNWVRAAEFADSIGVDIITTSLGYTEFDIPSQDHTYQTLNGRTAPMSIASTMAARKGIFVLTAAGNEASNSWHYISVPGDADSVCTVGAVDTSGVYAAFSSVGPTADGRIKPDLAACGAGAWVCGGNGVCFPGNGTSFATPVLAGAVACYWQSNRTLNNIKLLESLKRSASNSGSPNNKIGWGIPKTCVVPPDLGFDFIVYEVPSTHQVVVDINRSSYEFVSVDMTDLLGHRLLTTEINTKSTKVSFDGSNLASGVYIIKVNTSKGSKVKKMFKQ